MLTPGQIGLAAGIEALQAGEVLKGIEHLELVLENALDPRGEVAATAQGWLVHGYTRLGEPERALEHASIAIELVPDDAWLRYARGVALYTMGELEPAILAFSMAIERDAHHIKAWQWRAEAYYLRRRYDSAIADWGQALDILETTDQERLSGWRGQRVELLRGSLLGRARSYDASGDYEFARVDRERASALLAARQR